jgi:hypothetical protein
MEKARIENWRIKYRVIDVLPAPDGAVMMMILLVVGICKEKEHLPIILSPGFCF